MKQLLLALLVFYRYAVSPMMGRHCRFEPSCSEYAFEAIKEHGATGGVWLSARRICRCHPWHGGGFDPVPQKRT